MGYRDTRNFHKSYIPPSCRTNCQLQPCRCPTFYKRGTASGRKVTAPSLWHCKRRRCGFQTAWNMCVSCSSSGFMPSSLFQILYLTWDCVLGLTSWIEKEHSWSQALVISILLSKSGGLTNLKSQKRTVSALSFRTPVLLFWSTACQHLQFCALLIHTVSWRQKYQTWARLTATLKFGLSFL